MADKEKRLKWMLYADAQKFNKGLNDAKKNLNRFEKGAKNIFSNFAASLGIAFSVGAAINFTKELAKLSGEVEGVATAFNKIATQADLQNLRNQVKGTVSDLQLMKMAVSANTLGLPVQELGNLFEFAAKMAQDTGQSVDYLVDSIVRGIGRKSALILDNLGISAIQLKEKLGGISVEAASVGQVTEAVSKIAEEYLQKNGGLLDTSATKIQRVTAEWENFKSSLATSPEFTNTISDVLTEVEMYLTGYGNFLKDFFKSNEELKKQLDRFRAYRDIQKWSGKYAGMYGEGESTLPGAKKIEVKTITDGTSKIKTAYEQLTEQLSALKREQQAIAAQNKDITGITTQVTALQLQIDKIDELIKKTTELSTWNLKYGGTYSPASSITGQGASVTGSAGLDTKTLGDMSGMIAENTAEVESYFAQIQASGERVADMIRFAFEDMARGAAEAFGNLAAGSGSMAQVAQALMNPIANLAIELGVILLGVGKGIEALKASLATISGPIATIAGIALIALGTAAKAGVAKLGSGGGGYSGASTGTYDLRSAGNTPQLKGLNASAIKVEVVGETVIRNKDIFIAYKNAESSRKQNT